MKKIVVYIVFLIFGLQSTKAQVNADLLVALHNVTTAQMDAIASPLAGSLVYNTTENWVYQFNGTSWDKLLGNDVASRPLVIEKTADYSVTLADDGNVLTFDSATDVTLTLPTGLPVGFNISFYQLGSGQVNVVGATGVTVKNRLSRFKTAGQDAGAGIICTEANVLYLTGDLKL